MNSAQSSECARPGSTVFGDYEPRQIRRDLNAYKKKGRTTGPAFSHGALEN